MNKYISLFHNIELCLTKARKLILLQFCTNSISLKFLLKIWTSPHLSTKVQSLLCSTRDKHVSKVYSNTDLFILWKDYIIFSSGVEIIFSVDNHTWRPIVFIQPAMQDMSIIIYIFKVSVRRYWSFTLRQFRKPHFVTFYQN